MVRVHVKSSDLSYHPHSHKHQRYETAFLEFPLRLHIDNITDTALFTSWTPVICNSKGRAGENQDNEDEEVLVESRECNGPDQWPRQTKSNNP